MVTHFGNDVKLTRARILITVTKPNGETEEVALLDRTCALGFGEDLKFQYSRPLVPIYKEGETTHSGFKQEGPETFELSVVDRSRNGSKELG